MRHLWVVVAWFGCAEEEPPRDGREGIYAELVAQGVDRFLGEVEPSGTSTDEAGVTNHQFDVADGPMCLYGDPFGMSIRDRGHGDLFIFLQGGGLCYSELCIAITEAPPGIPTLEILDPAYEANPVRDWDVAYLPYCDGSLFSAALDVTAATFPEPGRILLAGSSGGGYGTIPATVLVRLVWPETPIYVFNDSGVGLGLDEDPTFVLGMVDEFAAEAFVPKSADHLLDGGHLTPLIGWELTQDPNLRVAAFSATEDLVMSVVYLRVAGSIFHGWLTTQLDAIVAEHPGRFHRYLSPGSDHTTLLGDPAGFLDDDTGDLDFLKQFVGGLESTEVAGVTISTWLTAFLDHDSSWTDIGE